MRISRLCAALSSRRDARTVGRNMRDTTISRRIVMSSTSLQSGRYTSAAANSLMNIKMHILRMYSWRRSYVLCGRETLVDGLTPGTWNSSKLAWYRIDPTVDTPTIWQPRCKKFAVTHVVFCNLSFLVLQRCLHLFYFSSCQHSINFSRTLKATSFAGIRHEMYE
jgi:hypothetical protein